jgi:SAM-dependent methyltransferase
MADQLVSSKKGEIAFRKKLVQQQVEEESIWADEYTREGIEKVLREKMKETADRMDALKRQGVVSSPYVEIGAERCQRSLVMENELDTPGIACDISYDMLKSCEYYAGVFKKDRLPFRICCDANALPFRSNSLPFFFCYETLHHFPDVSPIIREIHRVLSPGGYFFFDEEPYKKLLHLNLYKAKSVYSQETLQANPMKRALDWLFAERTCNEVSHGIVENEQISIREWKSALSVFEEKDVHLLALRVIKAELLKPKNLVKYLLAYMLGGRISGLCHKPGTRKPTTVFDALICPVCRKEGREERLAQGEHGPACKECGSRFPVLHGVVFLFAPDTLRELYPDVSALAVTNVR